MTTRQPTVNQPQAQAQPQARPQAQAQPTNIKTINVKVNVQMSPFSTAVEEFDDQANLKSDKYASNARIMKFVFSLAMIFTAVLIILLRLHPYKAIFLYCSIITVCHNLGLFYILACAKHLHYIGVRSIGIFGYRVFCVPTAVQHRYRRCIMSVSDISAMPGSSTHSYFLIGACLQHGLILIAISMKLNEWQQSPSQSAAACATTQCIGVYFYLGAIIGLLIVPIWHLEKNQLSIIMHYLGVFCIFVAPTVSFLLYQKQSVLSIVLLSVQYVTATIYVVLFLKCPRKHNDPKVVHKISFWLIFSEVVTCCVAEFASSLLLWCMHGDIIL